MSDRVWLNGTILPRAEARIDVEDRGFQFADGVYEVVRIYDGRCFALSRHMQRLQQSVDAIGIHLPWSIAELSRAIEDFVSQLPPQDGTVYLQATRGCAPRNHLFPDVCAPTVLFYFTTVPPLPPPGTDRGQKLVTVEDDRWQKCWIKSIALLANVLAKNHAASRGADEAVFVDNGHVTECSTSNFFAVIDGMLVTHPVGNKVLGGVTRSLVVEIAEQLNIPFCERPPTIDEVPRAAELFLTGTTREIMWVSHWNGAQLWSSCGPLTLRLHRAFQDYVRRNLS